MYLIDFKQKDEGPTYYPPLSAINALRNQGFFVIRQNFAYFLTPPPFLCIMRSVFHIYTENISYGSFTTKL